MRPTFRFSEGFPRPHESTTDHLSRSDDVLGHVGVYSRPHVSTTVVSTALARSAGCRGGASFGRQLPSIGSSRGSRGIGLDECAVRRVAKSWPMRPYRLNTDAPKQVQTLCLRRIGEKDCEANRRLMKTAVVRQLADCLAYRVSAVRVFRLDQRMPVFDPSVGVDRPDFTCGQVLLAPDLDASDCHVVAVSPDEPLFGSFRSSWLARRADHVRLGVLLLDFDILHGGHRLRRLDDARPQPRADSLGFLM
jgi:hypothetical protein